MVIDSHKASCPITEEAEKLSRMIWARSVACFPEWLGRCRNAFSDFYFCLQRHIGFEEASDVHAKVNEVSPQRSEQASRLRDEHRRMLAECEQIQSRLDEATDVQPHLGRDIIRRLENLIALFHRHENEERRLVQEVFNRQDGSIDLAALELPPCPRRQPQVRPETGVGD